MDKQIVQATAEMDNLHSMISRWLDNASGPNARRWYSKCPVCGATWWDNERHNWGCWVPVYNRVRSDQ